MAQNKALRNLLEVVVGSTEVRSSKQVKSGRLRKIATSVIIRAMSRVRLFSTKIIGENFDDTRRYLERTNAFKDGDEYILKF